MSKAVAKALMLLYRLQALNHASNCACGKTAKGVSMVHYGKTEDQYNAIAAAEIG